MVFHLLSFVKRLHYCVSHCISDDKQHCRYNWNVFYNCLIDNILQSKCIYYYGNWCLLFLILRIFLYLCAQIINV